MSDKPIPWSAYKISTVRERLESYKDSRDVYAMEYLRCRGKWANEMFQEYDTPKTCRVVATDPYHDIGHVRLGANAVIIGNNPITETYIIGAGDIIPKIGVPRWALVIEGEQNWEDVTG